MTTLYNILFAIHILFGSAALLLFWLPMFAKKGGLDHRLYGQYYTRVMYVTAVCGGIMALLVMSDPLTLKQTMYSPAMDADTFIAQVRRGWYFLFVTSVLTLCMLRMGMAAINTRQNPAQLRSLAYILPDCALWILGAILFVDSILHQRYLQLGFGVLAMAISYGHLRFIFVQDDKKAWQRMHLASMIGSSIASYTAFFTFGARHLFEAIPTVQTVMFIAPAVVGSYAIFHLSKKYN